MPLLPPQNDLFPPDLLDAAHLRADQDARWVAFYTLSRREKDLMRKLEAGGIPFYGPLVRRRLKGSGGRTRSSYVPLFPGYVFSLVDDEARRAALATNTISRWLPVVDPEALVADLRNVHQLIAADRPLTPEARLEPGQPVRVRTGALAGLEGVVVKRKGEERLQIAVRFLNQGVSIELEDVDVERM